MIRWSARILRIAIRTHPRRSGWISAHALGSVSRSSLTVACFAALALLIFSRHLSRASRAHLRHRLDRLGSPHPPLRRRRKPLRRLVVSRLP